MSRTLFSDLPQVVRLHILSFVPTTLAATTSCLQRAWRDEFVHTSCLDLEFTPGRDEASFVAFVDRVIGLRGDVNPLRKFSLTLSRDIDETAHANRWIAYVLGRGVAVSWESLPDMLNHCPHLETLVFWGLVHEVSEFCGNVCRCNGEWLAESCLLLSPVRVLKLFELGQARESFITQVRHFLVTMPNLERLIVYCDATLGHADRAQLSRTVRGIPDRASPMCVIQVISDKI